MHINVNPRIIRVKQERRELKTIMRIFFKIFNVCSGLDLGFFYLKSSKTVYHIKLLIFLVCTFLCGVLFTMFYYNYDPTESVNKLTLIWISIFLAEYFTIGLFYLSFDLDKTLANFYKQIIVIDSKLGINSASFNSEFKILCTSAFIIIYRVNCVTLYCLKAECLQPVILNILFTYMYICLDVAFMLYSFTFYFTNYRLKKIFSILENTRSNFTSIQSMYKLYVEHIVKYKKINDPLVSKLLLI